MINHNDIDSRMLFAKIKNKQITLAGNKKLRIYGTLNCISGKRMRKENRVFFFSEKEAVNNGYRACGHCMRKRIKTGHAEFLRKKINFRLSLAGTNFLS